MKQEQVFNRAGRPDQTAAFFPVARPIPVLRGRGKLQHGEWFVKNVLLQAQKQYPQKHSEKHLPLLHSRHTGRPRHFREETTFDRT